MLFTDSQLQQQRKAPLAPSCIRRAVFIYKYVIKQWKMKPLIIRKSLTQMYNIKWRSNIFSNSAKHLKFFWKVTWLVMQQSLHRQLHYEIIKRLTFTVEQVIINYFTSYQIVEWLWNYLFYSVFFNHGSSWLLSYH